MEKLGNVSTSEGTKVDGVIGYIPKSGRVEQKKNNVNA